MGWRGAEGATGPARARARRSPGIDRGSARRRGPGRKRRLLRLTTYDLHRFVYHSFFKSCWNDRLSFDENVHVNFDWSYPRHAWRRTEAEASGWLRELGLSGETRAGGRQGRCPRIILRDPLVTPPLYSLVSTSKPFCNGKRFRAFRKRLHHEQGSIEICRLCSAYGARAIR